MTKKQPLYGNVLVFILLWVLLVAMASSKHYYAAAWCAGGMVAYLAMYYYEQRNAWINSQTPINLPHEVEMHQQEGFFRHDTLEERRDQPTPFNYGKWLDKHLVE